MNLSGIIFAVLAVGWAVYLIPKALQRNDELARTRAVSTFSERLRVLGSGRPPAVTPTSAPTAVGVPTAPAAPLITREAARRAARRRRRVLAVLVLALAVVGTLTGLAYAPVWAPAIPVFLIVAFLVTARLSVRRQQARRTAALATQAPTSEATDEDTVGVDVSELRRDVTPRPASSHSATVESSVPDAEPVEVEPALVDEGSLWDPLPMTLPTYVTKPTARRTVRTIELTRGSMTSSGHDSSDTKLVQQAEAARKAVESSSESAQDAPERKIAGA